jgi:hypothetical protein
MQASKQAKAPNPNYYDLEPTNKSMNKLHARSHPQG